MIYDIRLAITYHYENPGGTGRSLLRLMPADLPGEQRRLAGVLAIEPPSYERREMQDFFGNGAVEVSFREAHSEITFRIAARVERIAEAPGFDISPDLARLAGEISDYPGLEGNAPHHFVGASPRVPTLAEITAYARDCTAGTRTALETVRALGEAFCRDMLYDPEATTVDTPPSEAFARRHGVCQDFAQMMIAGLRGLGIPAGYVSGFLRTNPPPGGERLEGADAMHAWVRAWCGREIGWVEYDPTNAVMVGSDHVVIARGRDYGDVAPVKGVLRMTGGQTSEQAVDVLPVA